MEKKKTEIKLLWMNGWFSLVWLIMFIPCLLFFVSNRLALDRAFSKVVVAQAEVLIPNNDPRLNDTPLPNDGSLMIIITDKGWFTFRNQDFFDNIVEGLSNAEYIEIWYNEESEWRGVVDIRVNQSDFIIPKARVTIRLYLIGLIFSSLMLITGIGVVIQTKGWGDYDLLEKYPEGLLRWIFKDENEVKMKQDSNNERKTETK